MGGLRKQNLEVVAMLDNTKNINNLKKIIKNKSFKSIVRKPLSDLSIDFLEEFSNELKKSKIVYEYPDLVYLIFWCRRTKINKLKSDINISENRLGRGLIFHICPSNIPTNFIYSFFFGLISGNSNIIKMPTKASVQKRVILKVIEVLFKKKKFADIRKSNFFIEYDYTNESDFTNKISAITDGRVVWGSDETINQIKKIWSPERSIDVMFSDRYSFSVINLDKLKKLDKNNLKMLVNKFYYDSFSMNQQGCNSPHFLFWIGSKNNKVQNEFWDFLGETIENKHDFKEIQIVDKYTKLIENILDRNDIKNIKTKKNNIYILDFKDKEKIIENIRGINGIFYQLNLKNLGDLNKYITKKCQTMTYFGFNKNELQNFVFYNNLEGLDRIVPIGRALDIDFNWDGYDLIKTLSRIIVIS
jgi:hypothetical protein